ncbi:MAG: polysaccharide biosynthesis protein, partial [Deltaproteobacteria bacterium]|nr:polysaccharide biosynthesis protein [Deltaproteobacteria bacterium]
MVRMLGNGRDIEIKVTVRRQPFLRAPVASKVIVAEQVTGLRPGEKLKEELVFGAEEPLPTPHPKINRVFHDYNLPRDFNRQVE